MIRACLYCYTPLRRVYEFDGDMKEARLKVEGTKLVDPFMNLTKTRQALKVERDNLLDPFMNFTKT